MAKLTYGERKALPASTFAVDGKKRKYPIQDISYFAGIVDGEGCILLEKRTKLRPKERSIGYRPKISVGNTDYRLMEWLKENFGGSISRARRNGNDNWKDAYTWQVVGFKAIELARLLMSHLKLKSVQAYCLSCFDYEALWSKGGRPEDAKVSDEELERREELYQELKDFNRKGKLNGTKITVIAS